jgi:hypothetical protein
MAKPILPLDRLVMPAHRVYRLVGRPGGDQHPLPCQHLGLEEGQPRPPAIPAGSSMRPSPVSPQAWSPCTHTQHGACRRHCNCATVALGAQGGPTSRGSWLVQSATARWRWAAPGTTGSAGHRPGHAAAWP